MPIDSSGVMGSLTVSARYERCPRIAVVYDE
jgi:hypothetical protein